MDLKLDWVPVLHQPAATATFSFYEDAVAETLPWFVHVETFVATDSAVDDGRILSFVNEQVARAFGLYVRLLAVRAALDALVVEGRTAVGLLWREVTCEDVPRVAGVSVTQSWYTAVDAVQPWFAETRKVSVVDGRVTGASVAAQINDRMARVVDMYARAAGLSAELGLPLGVRFTIGGG